MTESESAASSRSSKVFVAMLHRMLRPLVHLLVQQQIQYPFVSRILKSLYVDVVARDFAIGDRRLTVSRLSLLTGIHRREVKRIREQAVSGEAATPSSITLGAQIVARWTGERPWIDEEGRPRRLPRTADDDDSPSFHRLVNSVSVDIHPRSVLDEWIRLGVASIDEYGVVSLNTGAFVPARGFEEKAHYVGRNVRDHLAAACSNLAAEESPFLERSVYYASLPAEAVVELSDLARQVGHEALVRVNDRARELKCEAEERGVTGEATNRRITFGIYLFDAPANEEAPAGSSDVKLKREGDPDVC